MSKAIYIVSRKKLDLATSSGIKEKLQWIEGKILPDNIDCNPLMIHEDTNSIYCVFNPVKAVLSYNTSLCLGFIKNEAWYNFDVDPLDLEGTFAIFRNSKNKIQLITDAVASRTIWYYLDDNYLIASTSQLAIIYFLESFEFNHDVIPWVLSSGTLGPFLSWDKRINALLPKTCLTLDVDTWKRDINTSEIRFSNKSTKDDVNKLKATLNKTFSSLDIDLSDWVLPLSGGYDSRGILFYIKKFRNGIIRTITWGALASQYQKDNDAYLAQELSSHVGTSHQFFLSNDSKDDISTILRRFLINGEGRIDHIGAYMDGFEIWKDLFESKIEGIIRGDEGFGWTKVFSDYEVFISVGLIRCQNCFNLKTWAKVLGWHQEIPEYLSKRHGESLKQWQDRLYHSFRLPIILAALSDLKLSYIEIVNPLLFPSILNTIYELSDKSRTDKNAFKSIVKNTYPNIPFAKSGANVPIRDILQTKEFVDILIDGIGNDENIFPKEFKTYVIKGILDREKRAPKKRSTYYKARMSAIIKKLILNLKKSNHLDSHILAFRVFIIIKMNQIIQNNLSKQ